MTGEADAMTDETSPDRRFMPTRRTVLAGMGAGLTALGLPQGLRAQNAGPKVLRFGFSTFPPALKAWETAGTSAGNIKIMTMRGLFGYDANARIQGELVESWETPDPLTCILKLRDNAVFTNGDPVTAEDVVFTLTSVLAEGSTATVKPDLQAIASVEAVDPKHVKITLSSPMAVLFPLLANPNLPVISAKSTPDEPIACGPFKIKSQERGVYIELERDPNFYESGKPLLDGIRAIAYADENLRYAALESGELDLIEYLPWQSFEAVERSDRLKMASSLGPYMMLLFNVRSGPFADARVRQAMGYAIERQDVVDGAFMGHGAPLYGLPNPQGSVIEIDDPEHNWTYDPDRAKALLAEAGYPNGFDCTLLSTSTYGFLQDTAAIVQAYLSQIGINATLNLPDWATRVTSGREGKYDIAVHGGSATYNDPDSLYSLLFGRDNSHSHSVGFKSAAIDDLLMRGRQESDPALRKEIYMQLSKAYFEEVPQVPLNWRTQAYAMKNEVTGFESFPGFLNFLSPFSCDETDIG